MLFIKKSTHTSDVRKNDYDSLNVIALLFLLRCESDKCQLVSTSQHFSIVANDPLLSLLGLRPILVHTYYRSRNNSSICKTYVFRVGNSVERIRVEN